MENALNLNNAQIPAPNVATLASNNNNGAAQKTNEKPAALETPERKIKRPNVGVVNPPKITKTPIKDWLDFKKEQNPRSAYKITSKKKTKGLSFNFILSGAIISCGIIPFCSEIKNIIKHFKK